MAVGRGILVLLWVAVAEEFYLPNTHLRKGQVMRLAVDENEKAAYGKTIEKTKLKPFFIDLIAREYIELFFRENEQKWFDRRRQCVC